MTSSKRPISVFIASPNDLSGERRVFKQTIELLNGGFGDGADVEFIPLGWEDTLATTGRRSQGVINREVDKCDVFILALFRRWGQEAPDAHPYTSYTEEEFHRALERWRATKTPEIFVLFKQVDVASTADPGPQLQKVLAFRKELEDTRLVLYRTFENEKAFGDEIDKHLRAYARGELPSAEERTDMVVLPLAALAEVKKAKEEIEQKEKEAQAHKEVAEQARFQLELLQLQTAEDAAALAQEGKVEFARQKFAGLVTQTANLRILSLGCEFFQRTGDLDTAEMVLEKWLNLSGPDNQCAETAAAYGNLGNLYQTRGELERAEEMYRKAMELNESLGRKEGMAKQYGNLGNLYQIRGELERAEKMYYKALAIDEALGRKEGMANQYGNLGNLYKTRGELERAEEMYRKSLAIDEALGCKEGMANQYGNLGILCQTRGELERAEEMYHKSLALNESLGRKEGMANQYGNLGNLYQTRGELERAEEMYHKALELFQKLGSPHVETVMRNVEILRA